MREARDFGSLTRQPQPVWNFVIALVHDNNGYFPVCVHKSGGKQLPAACRADDSFCSRPDEL